MPPAVRSRHAHPVHVPTPARVEVLPKVASLDLMVSVPNTLRYEAILNCEILVGEVICHCKEGYTGDSCDQCAMGYFGTPSLIGGSCQQCDCHGNLDPNLIMEDCNTVTGQ